MMDYELIKNDDIIQLKQMIIFLKAELIKYETMDTISEMNKLKQEVQQLSTENEKLTEQLAQVPNELPSSYKQQEITSDWNPIKIQLEELTKTVQKNNASEEKKRQLTDQLKVQEQRIQKYEIESGLFAQEKLRADKLQQEVTSLKQKNQQLIANSTRISPEIIEQMDAQMKAVIQKAIVYEESLNQKIRAMDEIEAEIMALIHKKIE